MAHVGRSVQQQQREAGDHIGGEHRTVEVSLGVLPAVSKPCSTSTSRRAPASSCDLAPAMVARNGLELLVSVGGSQVGRSDFQVRLQMDHFHFLRLGGWASGCARPSATVHVQIVPATLLASSGRQEGDDW